MFKVGEKIIVRKCVCKFKVGHDGDKGVVTKLFDCGCVLITLDDGRTLLHEDSCLKHEFPINMGVRNIIGTIITVLFVLFLLSEGQIILALIFIFFFFIVFRAILSLKKLFKL